MTPARAALSWRYDGRVAVLTLAAPKPNILDRQMIEELTAALDLVSANADEVHAIVIAADGPHFSFGASIEEHLPEQIDQTLARLHALLRKLIAAPAPTIAAVRGQCLGGGFELALACDFIIAEQSASFALPEIRLGVFPPAGSVLLPVRVGSAAATEMVLTGLPCSAVDAHALHLVSRLSPAGELDGALEAWLTAEFLSHPAPALRCAVQSVRWPAREALQHLERAEAAYLNDLMAHPEAEEGIRAFLEKREPRWAKAATA